jgi:hypothetical protein
MTFQHNDQKIFWERLRPFKFEQYQKASLATLASVALFVLEEAGIEASFDNVAVAMFRTFPEKFRLVSFPEHPDFIRIDNTLRLDCKHAHLVIGNRVKGFALTSHGKAMAEEALNQLRSREGVLVTQDMKSPLSDMRRNRETRLIGEVRKSAAFQKYASGKKDEISRYEICDVLHVTLDTDISILRKNLDLLKQYSRDLVGLKEFHETASPVVEFLNFLESKLGGNTHK